MNTLESLIQEIKACRVCEPHLPRGANPVLVPRAEAKLLIVGQAPGRRVHETGIPWNDPSGDRLRDWLGIPRERFYEDPRIAIVPMGFCYPGRGKSGDLPPRPECAVHWREKLHAAMPGIELILPIGQYAQAYYLGARRAATLTETVRRAADYLPGLLPLPHPSPRNNLWLARHPWFEAEILPLLRARLKEMGF